MVKWERALLQIPVMKLIFDFLCREVVGGELEGVEDVWQFLGCPSTLSGREVDNNGTPVFCTLKALHVSLVMIGPYILGVLSDTSESSANATSAGLADRAMGPGVWTKRRLGAASGGRRWEGLRR